MSAGKAAAWLGVFVLGFVAGHLFIAKGLEPQRIIMRQISAQGLGPTIEYRVERAYAFDGYPRTKSYFQMPGEARVWTTDALRRWNAEIREQRHQNRLKRGEDFAR